jgi:DNA-binding CsgD family transcriptional regulator
LVTPDERRTAARRLHAEGHSYAEIARILKVAPTTAKKYCHGLGLPDNPASRRGAQEVAQSPKVNEARRAEKVTRIFQMRLEGMTVKQIAAQEHMSWTTVRAMIDEEIESRVSPKVERQRELANARLDEMSVRVWEVLRGTDSAELRLKAVDRLLQIERRRAANNGSDSPVRVEAVYTEITQEDMEIAELIREAQVRNQIIEGQVVDDADATPE